MLLKVSLQLEVRSEEKLPKKMPMLFLLKFHKLLLFTAEVNFKKKNDYSTTPRFPNPEKGQKWQRTRVVGK
jgi:hypothetical protein